MSSINLIDYILKQRKIIKNDNYFFEKILIKDAFFCFIKLIRVNLKEDFRLIYCEVGFLNIGVN